MFGRGFFRAFFGLGPLGSLPAPGTWGSAAGLLLAWILPREFFWSVLLASSFIGIVLSASVIRLFQDKDPGWVIWDEVCGMLLSVAFVSKNVWAYATAFILFRVFDIVKPWPLRWLEKNTGPGGIFWDDLAAGLYVVIILRIIAAATGSALFAPTAF